VTVNGTEEDVMPTAITPNLWFDTEAEEAAVFYCSVFPNSRIVGKLHYTQSMQRAGQVVTVDFELDGTRFTGINGGPDFPFTEAVSFLVECEDQAEVDHYWDALIAGGGSEGPCGWLKDKYGLSWQIVPKGFEDLYRDDDPERADRAMQAMMKMRKLDIAALRAAADGVPA
jgi:predicted 3-demethylubiquinone-9 3-methyltransferase (glyoxalase superfamily)